MEINSEKEFNALMSEIDSGLKRAGVPIRARPIEGLRKAAICLNKELLGGPLSTGPIAGNYRGESLSAHIFRWFHQRYGDRLKVDWLVGATVCVFEEDPWLVRFPLMGGRVYLDCSADLTATRHTIGGPASFRGRSYPTLNVLKQIKEFPEQKAEAFCDREGPTFLVFFAESYRFFLELNLQALRNPLAGAIKHDFTMAAELTCNSKEEYSQARWHALQAAEKSLKLFISECGEEYPHTHNLSTLIRQAKRLGLTDVSEDAVAMVQCPATLRYGEGQSSAQEAVSAQQKALLIAKKCVENRRVSVERTASSMYVEVFPCANSVESHLELFYSCVVGVPDRE